jgi:glycosyltransferase involved in cell wall biosynthesis
VPYHRWDRFDLLRGKPALSSLRSQWFDVHQPAPPTAADIKLVNSFRGFHVVTKKAHEQLRHACPRVRYLTNPVDVEPFRGARFRQGQVACWAGSVAHDMPNGKMDAKGFYSIILPACDRAGWRLTYSEYHTNRRAPEEMPDFYSSAMVYLCASAYEGASNSVMEALASGLYVICTDVGNHRELRDSGCAGMKIVPRTVEAFTEALVELADRDPGDALWEEREANRKTIAEKWSWDAWKDRYRQFFMEAL